MGVAQHPFRQVDVFTRVPLLGNPVAVVFDADGIDDATMQQIARWTNLSETTFVLRTDVAGANYRLRIFTPGCELPFAGHPTLGSAHAVLEAGLATAKDGRITQQCGVGLVDIFVPDDWRDAGVSFRLPRHTLSPAPGEDALLAALGPDTQLVGTATIVDVGPRWVIAQVASAQALLALQPDCPALAAYDRAHSTTGLTLFADADHGQGDIVVRSFAPADGINEDPVCGSGNGAVAAYRLEHGLTQIGQSYRASQGTAIGRDGIVRVNYRDDGIHIGGHCVTVVNGTITL